MSRSGNLRVTVDRLLLWKCWDAARVFSCVLTGLDRLGARRRLKLRSVRSLGLLVARIVGTPEDGRTQCNRQRSLRRRRRLASSGWRTGRHLPTEPTTHQLSFVWRQPPPILQGTYTSRMFLPRPRCNGRGRKEAAEATREEEAGEKANVVVERRMRRRNRSRRRKMREEDDGGC